MQAPGTVAIRYEMVHDVRIVPTDGRPHQMRFTRTGPNTMDYRLTVNDPKTYTAPWTVAFTITHEPSYQLFEYACHEGNMAMHNMLSRARAEDRKAAAGK